MKKILLAFSLFGILALSRVNAQIVNASFENWSTDTAHFDGFGGFFPPETFPYPNPDGWTTTNALSGADTFGNVFLVNQAGLVHSGSGAIFIYTDTLKTVGTPL